jgi:invasion protein IalB
MIMTHLNVAKMSALALTFAGSALLSFPAFAQDTAAPETEAAAPEAETAQAAPAEQTRQPGQPYFTDDIGDWRIRCVDSPIEGKGSVCQMYQLLLDAADNAVAEFTLLPATAEQGSGALATVVTPLETLLPPGVRLSIDGSPEQAIPFTWCNQTGCYARFRLGEAEIEAMKRGTQATLAITPVTAPDQQVQLRSSLTGFTAALASVSE